MTKHFFHFFREDLMAVRALKQEQDAAYRMSLEQDKQKVTHQYDHTMTTNNMLSSWSLFWFTHDLSYVLVLQM